ncbi:MAG TPA: hypothetical protein EYH40_01350 [Desulfurococcales archaeon]|nr:hypothetical protein [Desulfurococcales archaeon]
MVKIRVEAEIRPTENPKKVEQAVRNVFDPETIKVEERGNIKVLVAESRSYRSLLKLHSLLRQERILDASRKILKKGVKGNIVVFHIHKQAAYVGRLTFATERGESPLGPITFIIETKNPKELIDWLTPKTERGKPLWEKEIPKD